MGKQSHPEVTEKWLEYCRTPRQYEVIQAVIKHGTHTQAAKELNLDRSYVSRTVRLVYHNMSLTKTTGDKKPFVSRETTLYNEHGETKLKWVRVDYTKETALEAFEKAVKKILKKVTGQAKPRPVLAGNYTADDRMASYIIGDAHFGMRSWPEETGESYDLDIAVDLHKKAIDSLVDSAPPTPTGFLCNVGDLIHIDDNSYQTPQNKNTLDADNRYQKIIRSALEFLVYAIDRLLDKHETVIVRNAIGNHDLLSSQTISLFLDAWYRNEPRVKISTEPRTFWYYKYGHNLIGVTHGDTVKPADLPVIMADVDPKMWADTKHRYWLTGHVHHESAKEYRICTVFTFGTLAAKDAYHVSRGYGSKRVMESLIFHRSYGLVQRNTVNVDMLGKEN